MERHATLLLEIWREVCRHLQIPESVELIAPLLARRLPADLALVRRIDAAGGVVETVALGHCRPGPAPSRARSELTPEAMQRLIAWCHRRQVLRLADRSATAEPPGILPEGTDGEVLAGPLLAADGPAGVLLLTARPPRQFRDEHAELLAALLDPFAVALDNDRRLRELTSLREAVEAENRSLLTKLGRLDISDSIVGAETGLREVMEQVARVAPSDAPVLVLGETGSGKEVVARAVHTRSRRARGPFLRINCGAIPPELVDSELFGHEKGSFTGAVAERKGWFERADTGTLFLDEVGELPPAAQVRLLRVLQDGQLERVGGERPVSVDVRIVAATHRDLEAMVGDGRFRQDLWYRIAVFPIRLPPLRERPADVPALAAHFALRSSRRLGMPPLAPTAEDVGLLVTYPWPGNVRELAAVIERAAILGDGERLEVALALGTPRPPAAAPGPMALPLSRPGGEEDGFVPLEAAMARHIEAALVRARGRVEGRRGAAALLGINPHTLRSRMRKLGVDWKRLRREVGAAE
ncbi:sigma 54-interacting transcriptional regulator [Tautonia plasticadhaerens]|uniref:sigma 54-interacting transcriptional regulator n=1 Tax=Tautonia plasticadhaerens TaxID=2527974 RepID=UPI0018D21601|nr:sigma 54-interacting transcriptional regulator [Tautonia plasticadhaerens]